MELLSCQLFIQTQAIYKKIIDVMAQFKGIKIERNIQDFAEFTQIIQNNTPDFLIIEIDAFNNGTFDFTEIQSKKPLYIIAITKRTSKLMEILDNGVNDVLKTSFSPHSLAKRIKKAENLLRFTKRHTKSTKNMMSISESESLLIKNCRFLGGKRFQTMTLIDDILYLKKEIYDVNLYVHSKNDEKVEKIKCCNCSLAKVMENLPSNQFMRVNRSCIINVMKIEGIKKEGKELFIVIAGEKIPVTRNYASGLMSQVIRL